MSKYGLTRLIHSLSKEEIKNFKIYASRIQTKGDKKLLQLFDCIKKEQLDEYSTVIIQQLMNGNKNAYYRLKNRLTEEIEFSLLLFNRTKDERFKINNDITLARIFTYKSEYNQALNYLLRAEKLALKVEDTDLLHIIYNQIIDLSTKLPSIAPQTYIAKRAKNRAEQDEFTQLNTILAVITHQLVTSNFSGKNKAAIDTLKQTIEQYQFLETYQNSPQIRFQIHDCIKNALLQQKDFIALESYLIETLQIFEQEGLFTQLTHDKKIVLLVWLINSLIKNYHFEQSLKYIEQLREELLKFNKLYYQKYLWTYYQSIIFSYSYLGKTNEIIELLKELQKKPSFRNIQLNQWFIYSNLTTTYYCQNNLKQALAYIAQIVATDIYKKLNNNLKLSVNIVECMLRADNEDFNYVLSRIETIKKTFRKELKSANYQREKQFLSILFSMSNLHKAFQQQRFIKKVQAFIDNSPPFEPGANESINYTLWLKAKLQGQKYYDLVLETVQKQTKVP